MTALELVGLWLAGLAVVYIILIYWLVFGRGALQFVYNPVVGWLIRTIAPQVELMTVGARCYKYAAADVVTPQRVVHETFHFEKQWRVYPLTFLPRYFYELAQYGYNKMPMEQAARAAAGEPTR